MKWLELKIPPAVFFMVFAGLMWGVSKLTPFIFTSFNLNYDWDCPIGIPSGLHFVRFDGHWIKWLSLGVFVIGVVIGLAAVFSFWKASTTVDPHHPESASKFVDTGIYRLSRNPMYLGLLLGLIGWMIYLKNVLNILLVICFILYMNRFQIIPEERTMGRKFGDSFQRYRKNVRRWI